MKLRVLIRRFLGMLGFMYCSDCGSKLVFKCTRGYDEYEVYECPHCDHLDRFDI